MAYICREFTDQVSFSDSDPEGITYNRVLEFDAKFIKFLDKLPHFFCLDGPTVGDVANTDSKRDPGVIIQRYILHSLIHARRYKLHAHYMARGFLGPAYARSRDIYLEAAKLLDSLMSILPKHHVSLEGINRPQFDPRTPSGAEDGLSTTPTICESTITQRTPNHRDQNLADVETSYFDEIWQSFNGSVDTNMLDWSSLLSDLDTRFGSG